MAGCHGGTRVLEGGRFVQIGTRLSRGATLKSRTDSSPSTSTYTYAYAYTNSNTLITKDCQIEDAAEEQKIISKLGLQAAFKIENRLSKTVMYE